MKSFLVLSFFLVQIPGYSQVSDDTDSQANSECTIEHVVDLHDGGSSLPQIHDECNWHVAQSNCSISKIVKLASSDKGLQEIEKTCSENSATASSAQKDSPAILQEDSYPATPYCYTSEENTAVTTCLQSCWDCSSDYGSLYVSGYPYDGIYFDYGFYGGGYYYHPYYYRGNSFYRNGGSTYYRSYNYPAHRIESRPYYRSGGGYHGSYRGGHGGRGGNGNWHH